MLALAITKLPEGAAWASSSTANARSGMKAARQVRLFSRNGKDFTVRFASIAKANQRSAT